MRFGLFCLMPQRDRNRTVQQIADDAIEQARLAEELDFETVWFAEHHFSNYSVIPSPLMMAAYCAGRTDRIKLGTGVLVLPLIIINAQEAIKAVPDSLRQAAYGVGATKWQTVWHHVLPNAIAGILTGSILALSRALGETAPLIVVGASTFISLDPDGPFSKFTALPIQIYQWTTRAQSEFHAIAASAIIVLLVLLLTLNATAILLRNRFQRKY